MDRAERTEEVQEHEEGLPDGEQRRHALLLHQHGQKQRGQEAGEVRIQVAGGEPVLRVRFAAGSHADEISRQEGVGRLAGLLQDEGGVVVGQHVLQHRAVVEPRRLLLLTFTGSIGSIGSIGSTGSTGSTGSIGSTGSRVDEAAREGERLQLEHGLRGHREEAELAVAGADGGGCGEGGYEGGTRI